MSPDVNGTDGPSDEGIGKPKQVAANTEEKLGRYSSRKKAAAVLVILGPCISFLLLWVSFSTHHDGPSVGDWAKAFDHGLERAFTVPSERETRKGPKQFAFEQYYERHFGDVFAASAISCFLTFAIARAISCRKGVCTWYWFAIPLTWFFGVVGLGLSICAALSGASWLGTESRPAIYFGGVALVLYIYISLDVVGIRDPA